MVHLDDDGQQLQWSELPDPVRQFHTAGVVYEWFSLAGLPYDMRADGIELAGNRQAGLRFAAYESDLARALGRRRGSARDRSLVVDALRTIEEEIILACTQSDVAARPFLLWLLEGDQHRARQFLDAMTAYGTFHRLRSLRHENPQKTRESNDRLDLLGLSVALTSCDLVVTERFWSHLAKRAGFDGDGTARVHHSLDAALTDLGC